MLLTSLADQSLRLSTEACSWFTKCVRSWIPRTVQSLCWADADRQQQSAVVVKIRFIVDGRSSTLKSCSNRICRRNLCWERDLGAVFGLIMLNELSWKSTGWAFRQRWVRTLLGCRSRISPTKASWASSRTTPKSASSSECSVVKASTPMPRLPDNPLGWLDSRRAWILVTLDQEGRDFQLGKGQRS